MIDGRIQPQAIELEEGVLGAIMLENDCLQTIIDILTPESFYSPKHNLIYAAILDLYNENSPVDLLTVTAKLTEKKHITSCGGAFYISQLTNRVASSANAEYHARIVQQKHIQRCLIKLGHEIEKSGYEDGIDVFNQIEYVVQRISAITDNLVTTDFKTSHQLFKEALEQNERILSLKGKLVGITSGYRVIDEITGGWQEPDLIVLAAVPGMGKTALALELAKRPALQNIPTAIFSLEMNNRQLYARLISQETDIELITINQKGLNSYDIQTLKERTQRLKQAPIYFDDGNMTIFQLRSKARKLKRKFDIKLLVIDFLQKITAPNIKGNRNDEVTYISQSLKSLAKELKIPIIVLSSMNPKDVDKNPGKVPTKANLRDSSSIESDADIIILLYRPEYYGIMTDNLGNPTIGKCMCMIEKHRNGATGTVILGFEGRLTKFYSIGVDEPDNEPKQVLTPNTNFTKDPF